MKTSQYFLILATIYISKHASEKLSKLIAFSFLVAAVVSFVEEAL